MSAVLGILAAIIVGVTFAIDVASFVQILKIRRHVEATADEIYAGVQTGIGEAIGKIAAVATELLGGLGQTPRPDGLLAHVPQLVDQLTGRDQAACATPDCLTLPCHWRQPPVTCGGRPGTGVDDHSIAAPTTRPPAAGRTGARAPAGER